MGALAYLDIGPDNGGILLNLSEDGLALQAVAPLHGVKELQLGIQLPHSDTRIETAAEIVWLGATSRQAGVRFLNLADAARAQIREWIDSQPAVSTSSVTQLPVQEPAARPIEQDSSAPEQGSTPESRREKWLNLMAELEEGTTLREEPAVEPLEAVPQASSEFADPAPKPVPVPRPRPTIVPKPALHKAGSEAALPSPAPQAQGSAGAALPAAPVREQLPSLGRPSLRGAGSSAEKLAQSLAKAPGAAISRETDAALIDTSRDAATKSDPKFARTATAETAAAEVAGDRDPEIRETPYSRARSQLVLVSLFALLSILCFGIGTWVGRIPTQVEGVKAAIAPSGADAVGNSASSSATTAADISKQPELHLTPSIAERPHRKTSPARLPRMLKGAQANQPEARVFAQQAEPAGRARRPGVVLPVEQTKSTTEQSSSPALVPSSEPENSRDAINPGSSVPAAPPAESAQPQIVNGYVLQPSDRFVPCHLTYRVDPTYPPDAKQQGIQGTVKIHLAIAADGSVQSEKLISGPPQLVSAALEAAKYWQYLPALLNGQPVPTETDVEIAFRLSR